MHAQDIVQEGMVLLNFETTDHAVVVRVVNGVAQTPYKAKISQHDNYSC